MNSQKAELLRHFTVGNYCKGMAMIEAKKARIVKDEDVMGGAARIEGTRVRVMDIVEEYTLLDRTPEEIAAVFPISLGDVFHALSYYHAHRDEIKAELRRHKELVEKYRSKAVTGAENAKG